MTRFIIDALMVQFIIIFSHPYYFRKLLFKFQEFIYILYIIFVYFFIFIIFFFMRFSIKEECTFFSVDKF